MLNRLRKLFEQYRKGEIDKESYISKMHGIHKIFWEYKDFIQNKNVDSIKITQDNVFITTIEGLVLTCDPKDERAVSIEILNFGDYEAKELNMLQKFLKKDSVILDIGANIGWYCLNLSKYVPLGCIIAFEPIPKTFEYLKNNIKINNIKNVKINDFGLSDAEGAFEFYYDPKLSGSSSLKSLHESRKHEIVKCKLKRLDDLIINLTSRIDLIKCDVEGGELFVIKGALETLKKMKPVLFLELLRKWSAKFGYHPNDAIRLLKEIGYDCYFIDNNNLIKIAEINEQTIATNFFFLDSEKHKNYINFLSNY